MDTKPAPRTTPLPDQRTYTPAAGTDVTKTWERFGWVPPNRKHQAEVMARLNPLPIPEEALR